jgi:hypothetical protein
MMDTRNVAKVLDAGRPDTGRLIRHGIRTGEPISDYLRQKRTDHSMKTGCKMFMQILRRGFSMRTSEGDHSTAI